MVECHWRKGDTHCCYSSGLHPLHLGSVSCTGRCGSNQHHLFALDGMELDCPVPPSKTNCVGRQKSHDSTSISICSVRRFHCALMLHLPVVPACSLDSSRRRSVGGGWLEFVYSTETTKIYYPSFSFSPPTLHAFSRKGRLLMDFVAKQATSCLHDLFLLRVCLKPQRESSSRQAKDFWHS